jgi:hypothetical protein
VYFDVTAFSAHPQHCYGKLHTAALEDVALAMDGEGALACDAGEKRCSSDFVLWKRSKAGEPCWPSPWGSGRPGWHIECSVMCSDVQEARVTSKCRIGAAAWPGTQARTHAAHCASSAASTIESVCWCTVMRCCMQNCLAA